MTRPLRVAHVITKLAVGGAQASAMSIVAGLSPSEYTSWLVVGTEADEEGTLREEAERRGIAIHHEPDIVRSVRPTRDVRALRRLHQHFLAERPDIVHTHSSKAGVLGRVAARAARVPVVVHSVHGWSFHDSQHHVAQAALASVERLAARSTDALVVVDEPDRVIGIERRIGTEAKYALIRNGIDLSVFGSVSDQAAAKAALGVPNDSWLVGTVGRLAVQKDPRTMMAALAYLRSVVPEVWFAWAGDGPLRATTMALAEELGLEDRTRFVGVHRDVPAFLGALDAFALSSRWEGLPRTITEAMACGVPVVATAVDGVTDAVLDGQTGLLVRPGDPAALANALLRLHGDPALRRELVVNGRRRSEAFGEAEMLAGFDRLYRGLVAGTTAYASAEGERHRS